MLGAGMFASSGLFALGLLVAFILAVLIITSSWTVRFATVISPRLVGDATIAVWGRGLESADAATARAVEILSTRPGTRAVAIEPNLSDAWIGVLMGGPKLKGDGPRLISIKNVTRNASINGPVKRLRAAGIAVEADDHGGVDGPLERCAILAGVYATAATVLLCGGLFVASVGAGRMSVVRHYRRISIMLRLGARRGVLVSLIRRRIGLSVASGALVGLLIGEAATLLAIQSGTLGALSTRGPALVDGIVALPWPIMLFFVAISGAGVGAAGALERAERTD